MKMTYLCDTLPIISALFNVIFYGGPQSDNTYTALRKEAVKYRVTIKQPNKILCPMMQMRLVNSDFNQWCS